MGMRVNSARLPPAALSRLALALPPSMTDDKQSAFLQSTSKAVDFWEQNKSSDPLTHSELVKRIETVETAAKALQRAVENLRGDPFDVMDVHFDYLIYGSSPPFRLPDELRAGKARLGGVLEGAWTNCQTLRDAGEHTRAQIRVNRSIKPSLQSAKSLAYHVAMSYAGLFGERPPTSKDTWFVAYMGALGDILQIDVKFGYLMLTTATENVRAF